MNLRELHQQKKVVEQLTEKFSGRELKVGRCKFDIRHYSNYAEYVISIYHKCQFRRSLGKYEMAIVSMTLKDILHQIDMTISDLSDLRDKLKEASDRYGS